MTARYCERFETARGEKPIVGAADGAAVYRLLEAVRGDQQKAIAIVDAAYADAWAARHATIRSIAADPAKYQGKLAKDRSRVVEVTDDDGNVIGEYAM